MINNRKGGTYLETLITLFILLIILNPLFFSIIYLTKGFNYISKVNRLENEIEKIRAYYKKFGNLNEELIVSKEYEVEIKKRKIFEEVYCIEIIIGRDNLKRESRLYVYKQK